MPRTLPYGLRIALAFGDTIVREAMLPRSGRLTVGQAEGCTFILPCGTSRKTMKRQLLAKGDTLFLLDGFGGRLVLGGQATDVDALRAAGQSSVRLGPEDWGVLLLREQPSVRLVVQRVQPEPLPPMPRHRGDKPLFMTTLLSLVAFGLFLTISYLRYDPDRPELTLDDVDERFSRVMFNEPPDPPPEEEAELSDEEQEAEKARKRAGGPEGKFGDPNKHGPSNIPRNTAESSVPGSNVGLVKELNALAQTDTMNNLLGVGGEIGGLDNGEFIVGGGNYGMSTKGGGQGGGGEGEGVIHGTGDVDVGGKGVANRKRKVKGTGKPKEKKVKVTTGRPTVKGQLSKELIDREVRRHRAQISFCYNKQLTRHPNLSGKVMLSWVIAMDGSVKAAKVKSSSLKNKDAESCMVRALRNWRFPKPEGGVVQVIYPFIFGTK